MTLRVHGHLLFLLALNLWLDSQAGTIVTSGTFGDIAAAVNAEQPVRLDFDGKVIFPQPLTIDRTVEIDATQREAGS